MTEAGARAAAEGRDTDAVVLLQMGGPATLDEI